MTTLGVLFQPHHPPEALLEVARLADEAGLAELWITEDCFLNSGIAAASAALAATQRLRVGLGILPVPLRNVALCAMEIATMHRLFGDRAMVGIGHGVQEWMAQVGARPAWPLTLMREYATSLRAPAERGDRHHPRQVCDVGGSEPGLAADPGARADARCDRAQDPGVVG